MAASLRILFVFKRYYMGKDVMEDRYGRLFQFPYQLAQRGHVVTCLLSDYHLKSPAAGPLQQDGIDWISAPLSRPDKLITEARRAVLDCDVVIGSSDSLQICLASYLHRKYEKPCIVDLYDNYESFGLSRLPTIRRRYRNAVREADAITCVGDELKGMVERTYSPVGSVVTLNSTIAKNQFYPVDQIEARDALGLPHSEELVGVCGGMTPSRGIGYFYQAVQELWQEGAGFKLVLAGTPSSSVPPPVGENTLMLGNLDFDQMNWFYNALNLNVLQYISNEFGKYCYPQKMEEIVATGAPLVSANVGEMRRRFSDVPAVLFESDDVQSIKQVILRQLRDPTKYDTTTQSWEAVGGELERTVLAVSEPGPGQGK